MYINCRLQQWLQSFSDVDSAVQVLNDHHVPSAPVLTVAETMENAHLQARGSIQTVTDAIAGKVTFPRMPIRFSAFPEDPEYAAPKLGEHNEEILKTWLGKSDEEIARLGAANIIQSKNT